MATVSTQRALEIGALIQSAALPSVGAADAKAEARLVLEGRAEDERGIREGIMLRLAFLSSVNKWSVDEIDAGVKCAPKGLNDETSEKTMKTFVSEARNSMHPLVRDRFTDITTVVNDAWNDEQVEIASAKAAGVAADAPIKKAFSRRYHALVRTLKAIVKDGRSITTVVDFVAFARDCDPDHNPERIAARVEKISKDLRDFFVDFPHEDLKLTADYLASIDVDALIKARAAKLAAQSGAGVGVPAEPPEPAKPASGQRSATAKVVSPAPAPAPASTGEVDIDALLNDALPMPMPMPCENTVDLKAAA
jgi:hypothetical protein